MQIKQTDIYRKWEEALRDQRVRVMISTRLDRLAFGMLVMRSRWGRELANCVFIMVPDIGFILRSEAIPLSFFYAEGIKVRK